MSNIEVPEHILRTLCLNSFRYCLGRMTYAVSECIEHLALYWHILPKEWQEQIQNDIQKAIDKKQAGMLMDVKQWQKVLNLKVKENE